MSQQTSQATSEKSEGTTAKPARGLRLALGIFLWVSALALAYFVWQATRQLREAMNARAQAGTTQAAALDATKPEATAASHSDSKDQAAPIWDPAGVKDFAFTERSGRKVTKADLLGHPWLISFIFTRCAGPCPRVSGRMADLQRQLAGTDVKLVTLSVDPDFDKPEVLQRYAQSFGADANRWLYLTGDKDKTYRLINESFKMPVMEMTGPKREPGYEVLHSVNILRVDERGVVVAKYNALDDADIARLEHDLAPYINQAKAKRAREKSSASASRPGSAPEKGTNR
jgi:cytochrome oxidase Cu insertion factor (SCO1/SenC/PrrC family)